MQETTAAEPRLLEDSAAPLRLAVRRRSKGPLVHVVGQLDAETAPALDQVLEELGCESPRVELDLSRVTFVDRDGLGAVLLACLRPLPGARVRVVASSPAVHRMVDITLALLRD